MSRIAFVLALLLPLAASGADVSVQKADEQHGFLRATATAQAQQPMDGDEVEEDAWDDKVEAQLSANPDDNQDMIEARDRAEERAANGAFVSGQDGMDSGLALSVKDEAGDSESFEEDSAGETEPTDAELGLEDEEETPAAKQDDVEEKDLEPVSLIELGMQKKSEDEDEDETEQMINDEVDEDEDNEHTQFASEQEQAELAQDDSEVEGSEETEEEPETPEMEDEAAEEGSTVMLAEKDAMSEDLQEDGEQQAEDPLAGGESSEDAAEAAEES